MKLLTTLLLLALIAGGLYYYFGIRRQVSPPTRLPPGLNIITTNDAFSAPSVLGETVSRVLESGLDTLNTLTKGQAEPVINQVVSDLQERVKELPSEQYKKVKYEFCKDVLEESQ